MCLVETPYFHECGHYGHQVTIPNGRCIRADRNPCSTYGCWDTEDMGVRTIDSACLMCQRRFSDPTPFPSRNLLHTETRRKSTGAGPSGPIDVARFNSLVKLHRHTFERRENIASSTIPESDSIPTVGQSHARKHRVTSTISTASSKAPASPAISASSATSAPPATSASPSTGAITTQAHPRVIQTSLRQKTSPFIRSDSGLNSEPDYVELGRRKVLQGR